MPNDINAEKAVLCSFMIDNDAVQDYLYKINSDYFYNIKNQIIFECIKEIDFLFGKIDFVTIIDSLKKNNKIEQVGSVTYILELLNFIPSSANIENYIDILKNHCINRKLLKLSNTIIKNVKSENDSLKNLSEVEKKIYEISENEEEKDLVNIGDCLGETLEEIEKTIQGFKSKNSVLSGIDILDKITNGFKPGEMILISARPGIGKTSFALNIGANVSIRQNKKVAMFSLEMSNKELFKRLIRQESGIGNSKMNSKGAVTPDEFRTIYETAGIISNKHFHCDDYAMNDTSKILKKCRRLKRTDGLDLIIVDYIQLMECEGMSKNDNRQQEVSKISRRLKLIAKELEVPIIVLSQMSRDIEKRADSTPKLSDLRDSGAIEQDSDMVMFLHNPSKYNKGLPNDEVELIIAKHRNGRLDNFVLDWNGETGVFSEK